jgi:O-antigen ligase
VRFTRIFFYLLLLLLPVQLGKHFFFNFSYISGIRIDYLSITLYLTDIISICMALAFFWEFRKTEIRTMPAYFILPFIILCFLFSNIIFIAPNKILAVYKMIKIIQCFGLIFIISKIKPKTGYLSLIMSLSVIYISFIAVYQFIIQKSIGGIFWFLGERSFYASTPGIATTQVFGRQVLRSYSIFPHPNVLGGHLAIVLVFLFFNYIHFRKVINNISKLLFIIAFTIGFIALILTFSRLSWLTFLIGLLLVFINNKLKLKNLILLYNSTFLIIYYMFIVLSVGMLFIIPFTFQSFTERATLAKSAINVILSYPIFGIGLNNYIVQVKNQYPYLKELFFLQPVHNIYLYTASETGITGLFLLIFVFWKMVIKSLRNNPVISIIFIQLFIISLFDHYLFTLQQGILTLVIFFSLAYLKVNFHNNKKGIIRI